MVIRFSGSATINAGTQRQRFKLSSQYCFHDQDSAFLPDLLPHVGAMPAVPSRTYAFVIFAAVRAGAKPVGFWLTYNDVGMCHRGHLCGVTDALGKVGAQLALAVDFPLQLVIRGDAALAPLGHGLTAASNGVRCRRLRSVNISQVADCHFHVSKANETVIHDHG